MRAVWVGLLLLRYYGFAEAPGRPAGGFRAPSAGVDFPSGTVGAPFGYDGWVLEAAARYRLPPRLLHAVIAVESAGDPRAVSPKGALGLMQLMPDTAAALGVSDPFEARENVLGGAAYLRELLDAFQGDLRLALAAYNAGPGAVRRHGGVPPFPETREYLRRVRAELAAGSRPEGGAG